MELLIMKRVAKETACPVEPLARQLAQVIRERDEDDTIDGTHAGPLEGKIMKLPAKSAFGAAAQLVLAYSYCPLRDLSIDQYCALPDSTRDRILHQDERRRAVMRSAFRVLCAGIVDDDLKELLYSYGPEEIDQLIAA